MPHRQPKLRTEYMTYRYLSDPVTFQKFLDGLFQVLRIKLQTVTIGNEKRYTCGQAHDSRNPDWKPFQHFEIFCLKKGLDDFEVRYMLEQHLDRRLTCECEILHDPRDYRKRDLIRAFGMDFEGIELVD